MLNLYLAPRGFRARAPAPDAVDGVLTWLIEEEVIGPAVEAAHPPGRSAARLFHVDAHELLLPAELTFDALRVESVTRPRFLPERPAEGFPRALCTVCGDGLEPGPLDEQVARLQFFSAERFTLRCPACRNDLALKQVDFGQPVVLARFWMFVEGAATLRLNPHLLEKLGRRLGLELVVVPEVLEEDFEAPPARRARRR